MYTNLFQVTCFNYERTLGPDKEGIGFFRVTISKFLVNIS